MAEQLSDHDLLVRIDERVNHLAGVLPALGRRITRLEWAIPGLIGLGGVVGWILGGIPL